MKQYFSAAAAANDDVLDFLRDRAAAALPTYPTTSIVVRSGFPVAAIAIRVIAAVLLCACFMFVV